MKKNAIWLLILTFIIGTTFSGIKVNASIVDPSSKTSFKYVITPEWKNYRTPELKKMLNISVSEAENMETETLLDVVLDYPYFGDIYAFNDPIKAIDLLADQFNGLKVLMTRDDFKDKLVQNYIISSKKIEDIKSYEKITNKGYLKHKYRESLLSHPTIFNKLSKKDKDTIISNSKEIATKIDTNSIVSEQNATFGLESQLFTLISEPIISGGVVIRTGYVPTPNLRTAVPVNEKTEMTSTDKTNLANYYGSIYPNATLLSPATWKYNCHSYAWHNTSTANTWWMNYPYGYMTDGSYTNVGPYPTASGQKMFYPITNNEHSAIVTSPSSNFYSIRVTSKWGAVGLYSHTADHCPYFIGAYSYSYWRR